MGTPGRSHRSLLLPGASGLLLALAFPPLHLLVPSFVALVPLALHLDELGSGGGRSRAAFRAGVVTGVVEWALLLGWIPPALLSWSWLAVPGYLAAVAVLAGLTGLVAAAVHRLRFGAGLPLALALAVAWTAGEWLRGHLPGPLAFPWLGLGTSLTARPEWVGIAEVVGARGVTFWLAAVAGLLASSWRARTPSGTGPVRAGRPTAAALTLAVALGSAVPVWGVLRARSLDLRPVARVAVVQPNVAPGPGREPDDVRRAAWAALDRMAPEVAGAAADLVVLPEAVVPDTLGTPGGAAAEALLAAFARRVGAPVLVGALTVSGPRDSPVVHNSVVLVDGGGRRPWRYDKHHLVPLVERVPLLPLPGLGEAFAGFGPGRDWAVAPVAPGLRAGAFVCYESAFPDVARELVAAGADLLANVTNDGWFGGPAAGGPTHALWQHPAHLVMRAIETRRGIARAANTGFSLFVDPIGRVEGRTALFEEAVSVATVSAVEGRTLFTRLGDVTGPLSVAATVLLLVAARWRTARHFGVRRG